MNIIEKLKKAELKGRGGACFPTYIKWESVLKAEAPQKYIICNGAEGELDLRIDRYILENFKEDVINGIRIALKTIPNSSAYMYLNKDYYTLFKDDLECEDITLIEGENKYIAGEETALINYIEGKGSFPRRKPPYVSEKGLFNMPTLVNNVETFYYISKIQKGEYNNERFYMIIGKNVKQGIYELKEGMTIKEILKVVDIDFPFYVQAGGVLGEILKEDELERPLLCAGIIRVISYDEDPYEVMKTWAHFLTNGNCDKCTPCREGACEIYRMIYKKNIDFERIKKVFSDLEQISFCSLGRSIPNSFKGMIEKIL
ncbi:MAG: NADH-ubiquinone oxidoreductase-F iron-sulfur binding region domain-containing protein [Candidatus Pacebacteria bacterium]|nr:NADH-ubiquinone oxidoreductase-F iron-sulfur binding region domain-containing protein [Candidatus Paceibacterota bacterium]MDD2796723.1 NADH-ubiquinone oxidoreductase-F iron-sulfur binding region domain-containing protein [Candidatus Paceibacterota bacterium]MDD3048041.1 NADH-ubiquinone oxidoreductase-F iron-sulfur binding region domain-containing protein [Candidatus Paceibacterota bacterium]MDD3509884.1 NADH-ubiquinone oxidoreductase-F iron-sulfur binding region domain-containing protein [Ca